MPSWPGRTKFLRGEVLGRAEANFHWPKKLDFSIWGYIYPEIG